MSDELADQPEVAVDTNAEIAPSVETESPGVESSADTATASDDQHEQKSNGVQARFNKMTAEKYELKDRIRELEDQANKSQQFQEQQQPKTTVKMPDEDLKYDDEDAYNSQLNEYNRQQMRSVYEEQRQIDDNVRQQKAQADVARDARAGFISKSEKLGIDQEEAFSSIQTLINRGATAFMGDAIAQHDKAPAIAAYLAKNPAVFEEINSLSAVNPVGAAQKILSLEAEAVTRNISNAPPPNTNLNGGSAREQDEFSSRFPNAVFK